MAPITSLVQIEAIPVGLLLQMSIHLAGDFCQGVVGPLSIVIIAHRCLIRSLVCLLQRYVRKYRALAVKLCKLSASKKAGPLCSGDDARRTLSAVGVGVSLAWI